MPDARAIARRLLEDEIDDLSAMSGSEFIDRVLSKVRRIRITYSIVTPESAEIGDTSESGWIDEVGESMEPDEYDLADGETAVSLAISFLQHHYAYDPSSSFFHPGIWYSSDYESQNNGDKEQRSYHLVGFSPEEEEEIYNGMRRRVRI